MKKAYFISMLCALMFLFVTGSALAEPVDGCDRAADAATRLETAEIALEVNAGDYEWVINYWAEQGSGEDGDGFDGAVYEESVLRNFTREEMWLYLQKIFNWSSDMQLERGEQLFVTDPSDNSAIYMAVNTWFGTTQGGYYEQPGMSVFHFRPDEGCIAYQRDFFSEGDTMWGMSFMQAQARDKRDTTIIELGLTGKCVDDDGDGYTKYEAAGGCDEVGLDCNDYDIDINPGVDEINAEVTDPICSDGIDNNCNGFIDECGPGCATFPGTPEGPLDLLPFFALFLVPAVYGYVLKRRLARNRIK
jgi:hypothetical protein